jgi:hypothetical protein
MKILEMIATSTYRRGGLAFNFAVKYIKLINVVYYRVV